MNEIKNPQTLSNETAPSLSPTGSNSGFQETSSESNNAETEQSSDIGPSADAKSPAIKIKSGRTLGNTDGDSVTPMMRQYLEAKKACPEAVLFFRMGDFYEMFSDDAKTAARILGLALTSRDKGPNATPMCGFPHHQLDPYLSKMVNAGVKVAVCDQMEDPKLAKGIVKRAVTRVVSAGTLIEDSLLDPRQNNYLLAAVEGQRGEVGLAWVELSTGQFQAAGFPQGELLDQIARINPSEILVEEGTNTLPDYILNSVMVTRRMSWQFGLDNSFRVLTEHFGVKNLDGYGFGETDCDKQAIRAAGAVLDYLEETQKTSLNHIRNLLPYSRNRVLEIDEATRRSLEINYTMRGNRRDGSLLGVLDRTVTALGARLLSNWMADPLTDIARIERRLSAVEELVDNPHINDMLRESLRRIYDIERLLTRVSANRATPRDLSFLGRTWRILPDIKRILGDCQSELLCRVRNSIDLCEDLTNLLEAALVENCPAQTRDGGFIQAGFSKELDDLRELASGGKTWLAQYQARLQQETGIANLKLGYTRVFGYYIEITNANADKAQIPPTFIRKQTLKNAERYITPELKEYEEKVLTAEEQTLILEAQLFAQLRDKTNEYQRQMYSTATVLGELDVLQSLATLARNRNYCRPELTPEPILDIRDGRHPVLDITRPDGDFVPNDIICDDSAGFIQLITGPNMAGKSTFIRQVALITLMAQIGSFVPARSARIGVADRIFARVGASDELSRGRSTFMVEMTETARILNNATHNSLVILDEIGRGTSTYDGISLAWAVVEHLHDKIGCRTLFATHYHELTDLGENGDGISNLNVAVREWNDQIAFLHKIVPGAADRSYGIHVARLAGVPQEVVKRADEILVQLEATNGKNGAALNPVLHSENSTANDQTVPGKVLKTKATKTGKLKTDTGFVQLTFFEPIDHPIVEELRRINPNDLSPVAAWSLIQKWTDAIKEESVGGDVETVKH